MRQPGLFRHRIREREDSGVAQPYPDLRGIILLSTLAGGCRRQPIAFEKPHFLQNLILISRYHWEIPFFMFLSVFFAFNLFINEKNNINPNLFFFLGFLTGITSWVKSEGIIFSLIVFLSLIFVFYLYRTFFAYNKIFNFFRYT